MEKAKEAVDAVWDEVRLVLVKDVVWHAKQTGRRIHMGRLFDICVEIFRICLK